MRYVCGPLAPYVDWWATINEANTYSSHGWLMGDWPPGHTHDYPGGFASTSSWPRVTACALLGDQGDRGPGDARRTHARDALDAPRREGRAFSGPLAAYWNWLCAWNFLDRCAASLDWLGVQYYYDTPCRTFRLADEDGAPPRTDMGWRIAPEGLYHVVRELRATRYGVPIIVTENGLADARTRSGRAS